MAGGFPEGAACQTAEGQYGSCATLGGFGTCLVPSTPGNGVLEPDEACDDASACCVGGHLAPGAACSGICCPNCTVASTGQAGACRDQGGFCYDGACVTNISNFFSQPRMMRTSGGLIELRLGLDDCPLLRGNCTAQLRRPDGYCYGEYPLRNGTRCSDGGACFSGACVVASTCGDGVRQPLEECDDALEPASCSGCSRVGGCAAPAACDRTSACCDATNCSPKPASTWCPLPDGKFGFCDGLQATCTDEDSAAAIIPGTLSYTYGGQPTMFDPSVCPVYGCRVMLRHTPFQNGDCWDGPPEDFDLPDGTACTRKDGTKGLCTSGICLGKAVDGNCGNGILDAGEECDDNSGCCETTCTLIPNAFCSGGEVRQGSIIEPRTVVHLPQPARNQRVTSAHSPHPFRSVVAMIASRSPSIRRVQLAVGCAWRAAAA